MKIVSDEEMQLLQINAMAQMFFSKLEPASALNNSNLARISGGENSTRVSASYDLLTDSESGEESKVLDRDHKLST